MIRWINKIHLMAYMETNMTLREWKQSHRFIAWSVTDKLKGVSWRPPQIWHSDHDTCTPCDFDRKIKTIQRFYSQILLISFRANWLFWPLKMLCFCFFCQNVSTINILNYNVPQSGEYQAAWMFIHSLCSVIQFNWFLPNRIKDHTHTHTHTCCYKVK